MSSYIFFSLLAATSFALSSVIYKFTSKHKIQNNWVLLFYYYMGYLPSIFLIPIFFRVTIPTSGLIFVLLYAITFFCGTIFLTKAIYQLDVSTIAPFYQLQSAFIAILAYVFLSERFPAANYFFITLMLFGAVLVTIDERMNLKNFFQISVGFIILQQFSHAVSNLFGGFALKYMNSFTLIFWGDLIAAGFALTLLPVLGFSKFRVSFKQIRPLFISGFFATVGATSLFTAFASNLTISSALSLLTSPIVLFLTIVASIFRPKLLEHHTRRVYIVRAIGVLMILIGALQLSRN